MSLFERIIIKTIVYLFSFGALFLFNQYSEDYETNFFISFIVYILLLTYEIIIERISFSNPLNNFITFSFGVCLVFLLFSIFMCTTFLEINENMIFCINTGKSSIPLKIEPFHFKLTFSLNLYYWITLAITLFSSTLFEFLKDLKED